MSSGFVATRGSVAATAGRLIYTVLVKNITSAPKHTKAKAAIIPTVGHHTPASITSPRMNIRVKGSPYNSTRLSGYAVSKRLATMTFHRNNTNTNPIRKLRSKFDIGSSWDIPF